MVVILVRIPFLNDKRGSLSRHNSVKQSVYHNHPLPFLFISCMQSMHKALFVTLISLIFVRSPWICFYIKKMQPKKLICMCACGKTLPSWSMMYLSLLCVFFIIYVAKQCYTHCKMNSTPLWFFLSLAGCFKLIGGERVIVPTLFSTRMNSSLRDARKALSPFIFLVKQPHLHDSDERRTSTTIIKTCLLYTSDAADE